MDIENISPQELHRLASALERSDCPDCGSHTIMPGPRGGLSRNVHCDKCGSRFNVAPWYAGRPHRFLFVQRIGV
jgi:hypothetical protein